MNDRPKIVIAATAVVVVVAVTLLVLLAVRLNREPAADPTPTSPSIQPVNTSPTENTTAAAPSDTTPSGTTSTPPPPTDEGKGESSADKPLIDTATGFMNAWLTKGTPEQREKLLAPWALAEEIETAKLVDPSKLPTATVVSATVDPRVDNAQVGRVFMDLSDGSRWAVALVLDPSGRHGWKVKYIEGD